MEVMVDQFHTELLPVATQLHSFGMLSYSRRVENICDFSVNHIFALLAKDLIKKNCSMPPITLILKSLTEIDDKTFAAMVLRRRSVP